MSKKTVKRRKSTLPLMIGLFLFFLMGVLVLLLLVKNHFSYGTKEMELSAYYHLEENEVALISDGNIAEEKGLLVEGEPYASWDYVTRAIDSTFYWDEESQAVLYTTGSGTSLLTPDGTEAVTASGKPAVRRTEAGEILISLEYAASRKGMNYQFFENPNRVVFTDPARETVQVTVEEATEIRYRGGNKSEILKHAAPGEKCIKLEALENWTKVATEDGIIGYLPKKKLSEEELVPGSESTERSFPVIRTGQSVKLIWHQTTSHTVNNMLGETLDGEAVSGMNVISPTWYSVLDHAGTLSILSNNAYVEAAHARGLQVWGLIDNFNPDFDTAADLAKASVRNNIISQLVNEAITYHLDGINVDFEALPESSIPHYLQFLRELTGVCHANGLIVSVDTSVPQSYTAFYQRGDQGAIVDYMIMMGYDEHYSGSEKAGSVASLPFVQNGIEEMLRQGIDREGIICGLPFYTRIWKTPKGSGAVTSEVLGMNGADDMVVSREMTKNWDENLAQYVAESEDSDATYTIWLEEEESLSRKAALVSEYQLAGLAAWKLGFERASVWDILARA